MTNEETSPSPSVGGQRRRSSRFPIRTLLIVVAVAVVTSVITAWVMTAFVFREAFEPVTLNEREAKALNAKLARLDPTQPDPSGEPLTAERYDEAGAKRRIRLSERELNALLAHNTELARKLAIDLSEDQVSAKLLVPLDPEFPLLGGKTLRVTAGMALRYDGGTPVVILKGVSLWGIPIPNAWLGGLKNVDLVNEFGTRGGFWQAFSAGVADLQVEEGQLIIELKE